MGNVSSGGLAYVPSGGSSGGVAVSLSGNTAGVLGAVSSGTLYFAGGNNITLSQNGQSVTISGGAAGGFSAGVSTGGNTSGSTGVSGSQVVFVGGNNITLSQSTGANGASITISGANVAGAQTGISGVVVSNTTYASGTVSFSNANNVTFGSSAGQAITASYALNVSAAGGTSNALSGLTYSNVNGVSFGLSTGAGVGTLSASVAAQSNQNVSLYALGNTTQNSSTVLNASVMSFNGLGAQTVGFSNGSIQISVPATSSLSNANNVSFGTNGSTLTASYALNVSAPGGTSNGVSGITFSNSNGVSFGLSTGPGVGTMTASVAVVPQHSFFNALTGDVTTLTQIGQGSIQVYPINNPAPFSASRADIMIQNTVSSSTNSSHAGVVSAYMGLYTLNGSTLSLASSGSQSYQWTNTSNNSMGSISGQRRLSVPINVNYTGGDLWMGVMSLTSSTNANWFTASNLVIQPQLTGQLMGLIGQASNISYQIQPGYGLFSTTSNAMPASMGISAISGAGSAGQGANAYMVPVQFANVTA